jgi:hypothetical protein
MYPAKAYEMVLDTEGVSADLLIHDFGPTHEPFGY